MPTASRVDGAAIVPSGATAVTGISKPEVEIDIASIVKAATTSVMESLAPTISKVVETAIASSPSASPEPSPRHQNQQFQNAMKNKQDQNMPDLSQLLFSKEIESNKVINDLGEPNGDIIERINTAARWNESICLYAQEVYLDGAKVIEAAGHAARKIHMDWLKTPNDERHDSEVTITYDQRAQNIPVSYTHLTLPTKRIV